MEIIESKKKLKIFIIILGTDIEECFVMLRICSFILMNIKQYTNLLPKRNISFDFFTNILFANIRYHLVLISEQTKVSVAFSV